MAYTVDNLQIEITSQTDKATRSIEALTKVLRELRDVSKVSIPKKLSENLKELTKAIHKVSSSDIKRMEHLGDALERIANLKGSLGFSKSDASGLVAIAEASKQAEQGLQEVKNESAETTAPIVETAQAITTVSETARECKENTVSFGQSLKNSLSKGFHDVKESLKPANERLHTFFDSIKRIALYRAIRSALKAIAEGFKEGLTNAYMFSKQSESFTRLAEILDNMASAIFQMKNQLGALFGEVKETLFPIVMKMVDAVIWASERLTEIMSAFNGNATYLHAERVQKEWAETNKEVEKYKKQLLGIDEINNLTSGTSSGKDSDIDYDTLYTEKPVSDKLKFLSKLKLGIEDVLFNWGEDLTAESIFRKIFTGLGGIIGSTVGFALAGGEGMVLGFVIGTTITSMISGLVFDNDGQLSYDEVLKTLLPALGMLVGGAIGFTAGKTGVAIGITLGGIVGFALADMTFTQEGTLDGKGIAKSIASVCGALVGGLIGFKYLGAKGALIGITLGARIGYDIANFVFSQAEGASVSEKTTAQAIAMISGSLIGGLIGFKYAKSKGAMIGVTIGATIGFALSNMKFSTPDNGGDVNIKSLGKNMATVLGAVVGGYLAFKYVGKDKAFIGVMAGASLTARISDLVFSRAKGSKMSRKEIASALVDVCVSITAGAVGFYYGGAKGALLGVGVATTLTSSITNILFEKSSMAEKNIVGIAKGLASVCGMITGAVIGWKATGSVQGALIGLSLGSLLNIGVSDILFGDSTNGKYDSKSVLGSVISDVLVYAIGAVIGFLVTDSPQGAMLGGTIAINLKLLVGSIDWDFSSTKSDSTAIEDKKKEWSKIVGYNVTDAQMEAWIQNSDYMPTVLQEYLGIKSYAVGGIPSKGSMFIAGEAGTEFVGNIGNTSAVANTDQMTEAIYKASYMGMSQALAENNGNNKTDYEPMSGDELFVFLRKKQHQYTMRTGNI